MRIVFGSLNAKSAWVATTCHSCCSMYGQCHAPACHFGAFTPCIVEHVKGAQVLSSTFRRRRIKKETLQGAKGVKKHCKSKRKIFPFLLNKPAGRWRYGAPAISAVCRSVLIDSCQGKHSPIAAIRPVWNIMSTVYRLHDRSRCYLPSVIPVFCDDDELKVAVFVFVFTKAKKTQHIIPLYD